MRKLFGIFLIFPISCTAIKKAEEEHYALYKQKALVVYSIMSKKVMLTNPTCTRCYFLKGREYVEKWSEGDTMIIDNNLAEFYDLRFSKCR